MRAALYARVSSEGQAQRGTIASQVSLLEAKVAEVSDELVASFIDDGRSGARIDRPGLDELRDQAQAGVFERVWVLTPDRLARNFAHQMFVLDELARCGVAVCFTDAPPLEDDPQARLLVQVQGVIAEYERAKTAERQRRGKLYKVRAGEAIFRKVPFGYRRVPRAGDVAARLEVYEPEAEIVRQIFDDYVAGGMSLRAVIRRLYADAIRTPTGRPMWSTSTLGPLLRNATYAGTAQWYRHERLPMSSPTGRPRRRVRPREEWISVPVPAIISTETFEAAQRISAQNVAYSSRRISVDRWLLRGLIVCGPCGIRCACMRAPTGGRSGGHNYYYGCQYHDVLKAGGEERRCRESQIRADELDAFVFGQIREAMLTPALLTAGEHAVVDREPAPDDQLLKAQLARLQRQIDDGERERMRLLDAYQAGLIPLDDLSRRNGELAARCAHLGTQRDELSAQHAQLSTDNRLRERVANFAERVATGIDALDFTGRQRLMRLLIERVRVTGW